jgi:hypothetical protein
MKVFVYIFGQPGSGKTTLMREVCRRGALFYEADDPIKHRGYLAPGGKMFGVLGADSWPFGGTDTLSYTAVAGSPRWLKSLAKCGAGKTVFAEGDRLANLRFFAEVQKHYRLVAFQLHASDLTAEFRRRARAKTHGLKPQSEVWVRGRATKSENLAMAYPGTVRLDASLGVESLAESVWKAALSE